MKFKIESIREAPAGFSATTLALVTFTFEPDDYAGPLNVTRYNAKTEKTYNIATIVGARSVRMHDVPLNRNDKGNVWIMGGSIDLPDDLRRDVAGAAFERFKAMQAGMEPGEGEVGDNPPQFPETKPAATTPPGAKRHAGGAA